MMHSLLTFRASIAGDRWLASRLATGLALLQGYAAKPTPEGVARATTRTVVMASLAVLALDFVLTTLMFSI